jgi:hypothetical protein
MAEIGWTMGLKFQSDKFAPIITPQAILSNALMLGMGVKSTGGRWNAAAIMDGV